MTMIKDWLAGLVAQVRTAPDRRLTRALSCPECEHSTVEASADCPCTDPGCLCVELHETQR
jgi:hypothetical protein